VQDLTFRRRWEQSPALSAETCKYIGLLLQCQTKLWHFAFDCLVENEGLQYICHGLRTNSGLQEVEISLRSLYDVEQLGKGLAANKSIRQLKIFNTPSEPLLILLTQLRKNQSITEVHIENCLFTTGTILSGLKHLNAAKIKLSNVQLCKMTDAAIEGLKDCKCTELTILSSTDSSNFGPVMEGLAQNTSITKLSIIHNYQGLISNAMAEHVALMLEQNNTITDLDMNHRANERHFNQPLVDFGFRMICEALLKNNSLTKLDLGACRINDDLSALGDVLIHNTALKVLNLSGNWLNNPTLDKFCEVLKVNATLHTLNLGGCSLSCGAMMNLAAVLHVNRSLTDLDISLHSPEFTQHMYPTLCSALKNNNTLKTVTMGFCDYRLESAGTLASIADLIKTNTSITRLTVRGDMLKSTKEVNIIEFIEALKKNNTLTTLMCGPFTVLKTKQVDYYLKMRRIIP